MLPKYSISKNIHTNFYNNIICLNKYKKFIISINDIFLQIILIKNKMKKILIPITLLVSQLIYGQTPTDSTLNNQSDLFDMSLEQLLELDVVDDKFKIYGYIDTYGEKTFNVPTVENGSSKYESVPFEFTPVRNFHIYGSGNINKKIDVLFNLARTSSDGLEVRNAWGNFKVYSNFLQIRAGKIYRRFGLYNEKLDQIPTFIGIEPPELFDTDHLFLTRTTNLMIHGSKNIKGNELLYAITTENPEGGASENVRPLG